MPDPNVDRQELTVADPEPEVVEVTPETAETTPDKFLIDDPDHNLRYRDAEAAHKALLDKETHIQRLERENREFRAGRPPEPKKEPEPVKSSDPYAEINQERATLDLEYRRGQIDEVEYQSRRLDIAERKSDLAVSLTDKKLAERDAKLAEEQKAVSQTYAERQNTEANLRIISEMKELTKEFPADFWLSDDLAHWTEVCHDPTHTRHEPAARAAKVFNLMKQQGFTLDEALGATAPEKAVALKQKKIAHKPEPPRRSAVVISSADKPLKTETKSLEEQLREEDRKWAGAGSP